MVAVDSTSLLAQYRQLMPNVEVNDDPNNREDTPDMQSPFSEDRVSMSPRPHTRPGTSALVPITPVSSPPIDADDLDPSDDEVTLRKTLAQGFQDLALQTGDHFLGKSSSLMFLQTAFDLKKEYVNPSQAPHDEARAGGSRGSPPTLMPHKRPEFWLEHPVSKS